MKNHSQFLAIIFLGYLIFLFPTLGSSNPDSTHAILNPISKNLNTTSERYKKSKIPKGRSGVRQARNKRKIAKSKTDAKKAPTNKKYTQTDIRTGKTFTPIVKGQGTLNATTKVDINQRQEIAILQDKRLQFDNGPPSKKQKSQSEKMAEVRAKGRAGEKAAGIDINKKKENIRVKSGKIRVPDDISKEYMILTEVKNVKRQSYTAQLRDFHTYSNDHGFTFNLVVRKGNGTKTSKVLQKYIDAGEIILIKKIPN